MAQKSGFRAQVAALALASATAFAPSAFADDAATHPASYAGMGLCDRFETNAQGVKLGAFGSAVQFSEAEENDIAIILYTGTGLDPERVLQGGERMKAIFAEDGLKAECFVGGHDPSKGTGVLFMVNGRLVPETRGLTLSEAVAEMRNVVAEAKIVRQAGIKGDDRYILSSIPSSSYD